VLLLRSLAVLPFRIDDLVLLQIPDDSIAVKDG